MKTEAELRRGLEFLRDEYDTYMGYQRGSLNMLRGEANKELPDTNCLEAIIADIKRSDAQMQIIASKIKLVEQILEG